MNLPVNIEEIIARHLQKGFTKEDALTFIKKVTQMANNGLISQEEAYNLLIAGTIDCVGI